MGKSTTPLPINGKFHLLPNVPKILVPLISSFLHLWVHSTNNELFQNMCLCFYFCNLILLDSFCLKLPDEYIFLMKYWGFHNKFMFWFWIRQAACYNCFPLLSSLITLFVLSIVIFVFHIILISSYLFLSHHTHQQFLYLIFLFYLLMDLLSWQKQSMILGLFTKHHQQFSKHSFRNRSDSQNHMSRKIFHSLKHSCSNTCHQVWLICLLTH